jgi:hypothetical protein
MPGSSFPRQRRLLRRGRDMSIPLGMHGFVERK